MFRFPKPTEKDIFEGELEPDPEPFQDLDDEDLADPGWEQWADDLSNL